MIILDTTTKSLEIKLGATPATEVDWTVSYVSLSSSTYTPAGDDGTSNGTVAVSMVSAPSSGVRHQIKYISVVNANATSVDVTIQYNDNGTIRKLCVVTLHSHDSLYYADGEGFTTIAFNGGYKTTVAEHIVLAVDSVTRSTGTVSFSNSSFTHGANISFGMTGTTASTSVSGGGAVTITGSIARYITDWAFECGRQDLSMLAAATNSAVLNLSMQRFNIAYDMTATRFDMIAHLTVAGSTNNSWTIRAGIYQSTTGGFITLISSASGTTSFTSGGATSNSSQYLGQSGTRIRSFSVDSWAFTPGGYWLGIINSNNGPSGTTGSVSFAGARSFQISGPAGGVNDTAGNYGLYTVATGSFPSTIQLSDGLFYAHNNNTNQSINRQPYFRMYGTFS